MLTYMSDGWLRSVSLILHHGSPGMTSCQFHDAGPTPTTPPGNTYSSVEDQENIFYFSWTLFNAHIMGRSTFCRPTQQCPSDSSLPASSLCFWTQTVFRVDLLMFWSRLSSWPLLTCEPLAVVFVITTITTTNLWFCHLPVGCAIFLTLYPQQLEQPLVHGWCFTQTSIQTKL